MRPNLPLRQTFLALVLITVLALILGGVATGRPSDSVRPSDSSRSAPRAPAADDIWRFRGFTYRGHPDGGKVGLEDVTVKLYARTTSEAAPGRLIETKVSDGSGFFNFYVTSDRIADFMRLVIEPPSGLVASATLSEDGQIIDPTTIEWFRPAPEVHQNAFYFNPPSPTPSPTASPSATLRATATPSPTDTPTPTATPSPTDTPTPTATASNTPTLTNSPTPSATPTATPHRLYLPIILVPPRQIGEPVLELTILHNNDAESQLLNAGRGLEDYGGIARFTTLIKNLEQAATQPGAITRAVLKIEAGDNFLAGPEWNASLSKGAPYYDALGQDAIAYDVISLGNHDFDFGPDVTANFIESFQPGGETFASANLNFSAEPRLQALVAVGRLAPSVVVAKGGYKIGVIGLAPPESAFITSLRNVTVNPNTVAATQAEIDRLAAQGVNIIILATQLQSIRNDLALAPQLRGVDILVSGGGDEVLGNPTDLYVPGDEKNIFGPYPQWATGRDGARTPIVTTSGDYKYVGQLVARFDASGYLTGVDEGASQMVRVAGGSQPDAVQPDPTAQQEVVDPVTAYTTGLAQTVIGQSEVTLEGRRPQIRNQETNLGNLMVDSLLWSTAQQAASFGAPPPDIALQNGGGIRNNSLLPAGNVTELTTFDVAPFLNFTAIVPNITPQDLKNLLENAYARIAAADGRFAHVAGLRVVVDTSKQAMVIDANGAITTPGERVRSVILADGTVVVADGQIAPAARNVNVATIDFLARGGDQYPFPKPYTLIRLGATYQQALRDYIQVGLNGQITAARYRQGGEGRIVYLP